MTIRENVRNPASADRSLQDRPGFRRLRGMAADGARLWRGAAAWQQGLAIVVATVLGLQSFMRVMTFVTLGDRGWFVCWRLAGVTAACMLRTRRRRWPWILCGLVLSLLWTGARIHAPAADTALSIAANLVEVCIAAFFLPPFKSMPEWIRSPHITLRFTVFALLLAPVSGTLVSAWYFAHADRISYAQEALFWWLGDALGMVLWLPMTLVATTPELYALFKWKNLPKTAGLLALMGGLSWLSFENESAPVVFAILPVLLWIGLRLGFAGSVFATNVLALVFTAGSLTGYGPFAATGSDHDLRIRALQIFLMAAMLMALPISVVLFERDTFEMQLQGAYNAMEVQANLDPLTGVANRRRFDEALHQEWQRAMRDRRPIALLMVDSDAFKAYNDCYGHQAGDEILRRIAHAMRSLLERPADLVARYGGEEFTILLPGTDEAGTRHIAEHVRRVILEEQIVHANSAAGFVTVSIGCWSVVPDAGNSPAMLIREADAALYAAKHKGRNRVEYGGAAAAQA